MRRPKHAEACIICGKPWSEDLPNGERGYGPDDQWTCSSECHTKKFWNDKLKVKDNPKTVRVNGQHYYIGPVGGSNGWHGHAGRAFYILFDDGRLTMTKNLWHNGEIPVEFSVLLSDNAKFISEEEYNERKEQSNV